MKIRILALVGAIAATAVIGGGAGANHVREGDVRFKVICAFDQAGEIDPIVHPGEVGTSHRHDFFGRRAMTADVTTFDELVAGRTTCNDLDFASYWSPSLLLTDGTWAEPSRMAVYFRRGNRHDDIQPFPPGLKVVAGAGHRLSPADSFGWQCGEQKRGSVPPESCPDSHLTMVVVFPDCWNGANLDSPDHRSHMAYSGPGDDANVCPDSHPVPVPKMTQYVNFPTVTAASQVAGLSSGGVGTAHADFFNGWDPIRLAERVDTCLNGFQRCEAGLEESPEEAHSPEEPSADEEPLADQEPARRPERGTPSPGNRPRTATAPDPDPAPIAPDPADPAAPDPALGEPAPGAATDARQQRDPDRREAAGADRDATSGPRGVIRARLTLA